jgi:hypothetical protein
VNQKLNYVLLFSGVLMCGIYHVCMEQSDIVEWTTEFPQPRPSSIPPYSPRCYDMLEKRFKKVLAEERDEVMLKIRRTVCLPPWHYTEAKRMFCFYKRFFLNF